MNVSLMITCLGDALFPEVGFTRQVRGWHLGRDLAGTLTVTALERALRHHRPEIHHSDQGVQYAATDYVDRLRQVQAGISMVGVGKPEENGFAGAADVGGVQGAVARQGERLSAALLLHQRPFPSSSARPSPGLRPSGGGGKRTPLIG
jgi:hypothetical protein